MPVRAADQNVYIESHIPHYVNLANSLRGGDPSAEFAPSDWQIEYSLSAATQILFEPAAA